MGTWLTGRRALAGGAAYIVAYLLMTALAPAPGSPALRVLLARLFFLPPTALALAATWAALRGSRGTEKIFWALLTGSSLGGVLHALNELLRALAGLGAPVASGPYLGEVVYYAYLVLVTVSLLVRPDLPRGPIEARRAVLEWAMAAVGVGFLILYFAVLPSTDARNPWFVVYTALELLPGLGALSLSLAVRDEPFRTVYRLLALGFLAEGLAGMVPNWFYPRGGYPLYSPLGAIWALPFFPMAAAALCPRGPTWVRARARSSSEVRRARIAMLAVAFPPSLDLAIRLSGWQPHVADERSQAALFASALLSILVALRVRPIFQPPPEPESPLDTPEVRSALGEPSEFLQLASGVAHELNNPLMAVAGWAELALRRGTEAREPLEALLASTRRAAEDVTRLQRLARSDGEGE